MAAGGRGGVGASVTIRRPVGEVFAFYRDFTHFPQFLGDVMDVRHAGGGRTRWTVRGPMGMMVHWAVEVTEERPDTLIRYATTGGLTGGRGRWSVHFSPGGRPDTTVVREVMTIPLGRWGATALGLIGKPPAAESEANLHRLQQLLETGEVTDTRHAVPGKFGPRSG